MLAMGRALMSKPRIILMDEPSMGLSPLLVSEIFDIIKVINESGTKKVNVLVAEDKWYGVTYKEDKPAVVALSLIHI